MDQVAQVDIKALEDTKVPMAIEDLVVIKEAAALVSGRIMVVQAGVVQVVNGMELGLVDGVDPALHQEHGDHNNFIG
uniref:Uncharacterized protein n=1 Tax=Acrobeloides nanus TaxID=290746 RepID=A0A914E9N6_9BILA